MSETKLNSNLNYKIAVTGAFGALTVIMTFTPIGFIQVGSLAITLIHIPVILATLLAGLVPGLCTGLIFGVASLIKAAQTQIGLNPLFLNPMVSVFPRLIFPIVVWGIFKLLNLTKSPKIFNGVLASGIGTLAHTFLVLGMLFVFYASKVIEAMQGVFVGMTKFKAWWTFTIATLLSNGIWEIVAAVVIVLAVLSSVFISKKRKSKLSQVEDEE